MRKFMALLAKTTAVATLIVLLGLPTYTSAQSSQTLEAQVRYLSDREEISQQIINYALAFDRKDWNLHRSVFADEIQMDFSASIGDGLQTLSADDWVNGVRPFFENLEATQHIGIPLSIQINGDEAYVISLLNATHYLPNEQGNSTQTMIGYYENWLRRIDSSWKIDKIVQHVDWNEGNWYIFEKAAGISE